MNKKIFFALFAAGILTLTACQQNGSFSNVSESVSTERMPEPEFPLDKDTIMKTAAELGLSGVISEDESEEKGSRENTIYTDETVIYSNYILRDPERKLQADSQYTVLHSGITSFAVDGNRYLSVALDAKSHMLDDKPFAWEDWKQEIVFCTKLYGGFEDAEEVYRALSGLDVPDGDDGRRPKWGVQLSNGYCAVQKSESDDYSLWINFYESEELYLKTQQAQKEAVEKAQEDKKKRREAYLKRLEEPGPQKAGGSSK